MALTVIAMYDIGEDRRRARVAATLQRWGDRIQYSVFVCRIEETDLALMESTVKAIVSAEEDSFFIVRQCAACWEGMRVVGQAEPPTPALYWAAF